jgi:hypothetical protein
MPFRCRFPEAGTLLHQHPHSICFNAQAASAAEADMANSAIDTVIDKNAPTNCLPDS